MSKKHFRSHRASSAAKVVRMFPVYPRKVMGAESVLGERPLTFIDAATREVWIGQGAVVSISRGKAVRLLLNLAPQKQQSVLMGPSVIEGSAAGLAYARACLAGWRPSLRAA